MASDASNIDAVEALGHLALLLAPPTLASPSPRKTRSRAAGDTSQVSQPSQQPPPSLTMKELSSWDAVQEMLDLPVGGLALESLGECGNRGGGGDEEGTVKGSDDEYAEPQRPRSRQMRRRAPRRRSRPATTS